MERTDPCTAPGTARATRHPRPLACRHRREADWHGRDAVASAPPCQVQLYSQANGLTMAKHIRTRWPYGCTAV